MLKKALAICAAGLLVTVGAANADVPNCDESIATLKSASDLSMCPRGDNTGGNDGCLIINVQVFDVFQNPVEGYPADSICVQCPELTTEGADLGEDGCAEAATDSTGSTQINFCQARWTGAAAGWCNSTPIQLSAGAFTCSLTPARANPSLKFYDLDNSGPEVGPTDLSKLASAWLKGKDPAFAYADYNFTNDFGDLVGPSDLSRFASHWNHTDVSP